MDNPYVIGNFTLQLLQFHLLFGRPVAVLLDLLLGLVVLAVTIDGRAYPRKILYNLKKKQFVIQFKRAQVLNENCPMYAAKLATHIEVT